MTATPLLQLAADPIVLHAFGTPIPKGSKSAVVRGGRGYVIEAKSSSARKAQQTWISSVTSVAQAWRNAHPGPPIDAPITIVIDFYLERPKSTPKRVVWQTKKPDWDKLARLVCDALTGVIYADDARIVRALVTKQFAVGRPAGCTITIGEMQ